MTTIDLPKYRAAIEAKNQEIAAAQLTLSNLQAESAQLKSDMADEFRSLIKQGSTTGDPLTDGVISAYGFDLNILGALTAFSKQLMDAKGQECLIVCPWRQRFHYTGHYDEEAHSFAKLGCIFGRLTGESLLIETPERRLSAKLSFPFDGYVIKDMELQQDSKRFPGRFVMSESLIGHTVTTCSFVLFITHKLKPPIMHHPHMATESEKYRVLIGEEIESLQEAPLSLGGDTLYHATIQGLRDTLLTAPVGGQRELLPS